MARLAAYYQEDFHYPPVGYGQKQRKSAYVVYEDPRNHFHQFSNGERMRGLAASEPSLSPTHVYPSRPEATLRHRPFFYGSQLIESPGSSIQYLNDTCNGRINQDYYDDESLSSYCDAPSHNNRFNQKCAPSYRERSRKRYSYAEPIDGLHSPEAYIDRSDPQRYLYESDVRNYNKLLQPDNYSANSSQNYSLRTESRQSGKWQWQTPPLAYSNATYLSPPSPLDSGLSSQSITSSPSLEADPLSFCGDIYQRHSARQPACSCPKIQLFHPEEHDSNEQLSPCVRSMNRPGSAISTSRNFKKGPHLSRRMSYAGDEYDNHIPRNHIRYGKMGLLGETLESEHAMPASHSNPKHLENFPRRDFSPTSVSYVYTDRNGVPLKKAHRRKSQKSSQNYNSPCLIIVESPEKNSSSPPSPSQEASDKSQGPDSPMSVTASNSDTPSVSSSNNELDVDERTTKPTDKSGDKKTELEIRELEAMYEKCNLGDRDLLDRAERRDLPTAHQLRPDKGRLTRSNSDTLYEVMSPVFRNPYENPRRAPPFRRSGMPDRIADDMALRKQRRPKSTSSFSLAENTITYMLCSSHFTPSVPSGYDLLELDNPDVELDDFSYRKHYVGKKSKIMDPQPPFGIPLMPPPPQKVFNDYLHAVPAQGPQPLCHPRGNPDVVRDDLAFRALRKDEPERMYYDISQVYRKERI